MRLTWKRQPNETGLRRVCQGERGYDLNLDGKRVASVHLARSLTGDGVRGYYWAAPSNTHWPLYNTAAQGVFFTTIEEAKTSCKEWIKKALESATKEGP